MIVEICANSFDSALAAKLGGATRIELCTALSLGGLTPSHGLIEKVMQTLDIPVHVLIRPRGGDFTYSERELDIMKRDISYCKNLGCAGIVSGVLTTERNIDILATKQLMEASRDLDFTFHRAFDWVKNPTESLQQLTELEVQRILTSGQESKAIDGLGLLKNLLQAAQGNVEIMPGSGINSNNALKFKEAGFASIHLSATKKPTPSLKENTATAVQSSFFGEDIEGVSDLETIQYIVDLVS